MKIRQMLLAILLVVSMALSITACGSETKNSGASTAEVTTTSQTTAAEEMKTIEPPEDGWTPELLNEVMYLNGKPFSLPCTLKDLGEGYSFSKDVSDYNDGTGTCELLYNKEIICIAIINNYSDKEGISDNSQIFRIMFTKQITDKIKKGFDIQKCSVNGLFIGSTKEEVIHQLGYTYDNERSDEQKYFYNYKNTNNIAIHFAFFDEENKSSASLIMINNDLFE